MTSPRALVAFAAWGLSWAAFGAGCQGPNPAYDTPPDVAAMTMDAAKGDGGATAGGTGGGLSGSGGAVGSGSGGVPGAGGDSAGGAGGQGGEGGGTDAAAVDVAGSPSDAPTVETAPAPAPDAMADVTAPDVATPTDLASDGSGVLQHGLHAEYFDDTVLTKLAYTEIDPKIEFAWGKAAPDPRLNFAHGWSVRWTGKLKPRHTDLYKLTAHAGDGVRVFIDGKELITDWEPHADRDASVNITLDGTHTHDIKVEYNFLTGWAVCRLSWSSPSQISEVIPADAYTP
jgi:hypothetical protein